MLIIKKQNQYLYHHGIKGQKWGVRNGPPYPIEKNINNKISDYRTVVNKGGTIYRTTDRKEKHHGHAYVTINTKDAKVYEQWGNVHAEYKALEDIIIPTKNVQVKTACDLIRKDNEVRMAIAKAHIGLTSGNYKRITKMAVDKLGGWPYNTFASMLDENATVRDKYIASLSEKGYNAVIDAMDEGFMADMPLIIFDRAKTLSNPIYK